MLDYKTRTFQEALSDLKTANEAGWKPEEKDEILTSRGIQPDEFDAAFNMYNTERQKLAQEYITRSGSDPKAFTEKDNELMMQFIDDEMQPDVGYTGVVGRVVGRGISDLFSGLKNLNDMIEPYTPTGAIMEATGLTDAREALYDRIGVFLDENTPDFVKRKFQRLTDPYHGNDEDYEEIASNIVGFGVGGFGTVKGLSLLGNGLVKASPYMQRILTNASSRVGNTITEKVAAGTLKGAAIGAAATPFEPAVYGDDVGRELAMFRSDGTQEDFIRKRLEYSKMSESELWNEMVEENLAFNTLVGAGFSGAGSIIAKTYGKYGADVVKKAANNFRQTPIGKAARAGKKLFSSRQGLSDKVFESAIKRDNAVAASLDAAEGLNQDFKRAMKKYAGGNKDIERRLTVISNYVLQGHGTKLLEKEAPELVPILKAMRTNITDASGNLQRNMADKSMIKAIIGDNLDVYVNRSYRAFEDPKFKKELVKRIKNYNPAGDDVILRDALNRMKANSKNITDDQARIQLLRLMKETPTDELREQLTNVGRVTESRALKRRNPTMSKEFRKLLGQVKDPTSNYANTMRKLSRMNAETTFLTEVRDELLAEGKLLKTGKLSMDEFDKVANIGELAEQRLGRIFGNKQVVNPLKGYSSDPEVAEILENGLDVYSQTKDGRLMNMWLKYKGLTQAAQTVYNPMTHMYNVLGNGTMMLANGMLPVGKNSLNALQTSTRQIMNSSTQEFGKRLSRYRELGIVGSNVEVQTVRRNLKNFVNDPDSALDGMASMRGTGITDKIAGVYQAEDDVFKITHFENTLDYMKKAFPNKSADEIERMAAQRTRDLLPNYNQASKAVQLMRRMPVGDFISFPVEIMRNTKNLMKYTIQDIRSGNEVLQKQAFKRLIGMGTTAMGFDAASRFSQEANGISNVEAQAMDMVGPSWEVGSPKFYLSGINEDSNGHIGYDYYDMGRADPYAFVKQGAKAIWKMVDAGILGESDEVVNRELDKALESLAMNTLGTFLAPSMSTEALMNAAKYAFQDSSILPQDATVAYGIKEAGAQIGLDVPDAAALTGAAVVDPLLPSWVNRLVKAKEFSQREEGMQEGISSKSGTTIIPEEVSPGAFIGLSRKRMDITAGLHYNFSKFERGVTKAMDEFNNNVADRNVSSDALTASYGKALEEAYENTMEIRSLIRTYRELGMSNNELLKALSNQRGLQNSVPKRLENLLKIEAGGWTPPQIPQSAFQGFNRDKLDMNTINDMFLEYQAKPLDLTPSMKKEEEN